MSGEVEVFRGGGALELHRGSVSAVGMTLPEDVSEEDWVTTGSQLSAVVGALAGWALGDWYSVGKRRFPDVLSEMERAGSVSPAARKASRVGERFPREVRERYLHERMLPYEYFEVVARYDLEQAVHWLDVAVDDALTVEDFKAVVRGAVRGADEAPALPQGEPTSQPGFVYELGPHRLLVGDCTNAEWVAFMLGDERASLVWTDPPYGVNYVGQGAGGATIQGDDPGEPLYNLLCGAWRAAEPVCRSSTPFYVTGPSGSNSLEFMRAFRDVGWRLEQLLVWEKNRPVLGRKDYHFAHETVYYGYTPGPSVGRMVRLRDPGSPERWYGGDGASSVHQVATPSSSPDHPTMKPVELIRKHMLNSSRRGEVVLDPFAGSGSTMAAAHAEGRRAYMVEVDPRYADVIRARWDRIKSGG
jgi:DNA modification methylase